MAKKKTGDERYLGVRHSFFFTQELTDALQRYLDETAPRPTKTSTVITALEQFLKEKGYWPPPQQDESS